METSLVRDTVQTYVDAYLAADSARLLQAFDPETRLQSIGDDGALERTEMRDWVAGLDARRARGDVRTGEPEILALDVTDTTASVKLRLRLPALEFTDYLSLLKTPAGWRIVGKIYSARAR